MHGSWVRILPTLGGSVLFLTARLLGESVTLSDPDNPRRYYAVCGHVVGVTAKGEAQHIEALVQKHLGRERNRMAVNARLMDPEILADARVRHLDDANR